MSMKRDAGFNKERYTIISASPESWVKEVTALEAATTAFYKKAIVRDRRSFRRTDVPYIIRKSRVDTEDPSVKSAFEAFDPIQHKYTYIAAETSDAGRYWNSCSKVESDDRHCYLDFLIDTKESLLGKYARQKSSSDASDDVSAADEETGPNSQVEAEVEPDAETEAEAEEGAETTDQAEGAEVPKAPASPSFDPRSEVSRIVFQSEETLDHLEKRWMFKHDELEEEWARSRYEVLRSFKVYLLADEARKSLEPSYMESRRTLISAIKAAKLASGNEDGSGVEAAVVSGDEEVVEETETAEGAAEEEEAEATEGSADDETEE